MHAFSARLCNLFHTPRKKSQMWCICLIFGVGWCSAWLSSPSLHAPSLGWCGEDEGGDPLSLKATKLRDSLQFIKADPWSSWGAGMDVGAIWDPFVMPGHEPLLWASCKTHTEQNPSSRKSSSWFCPHCWGGNLSLKLLIELGPAQEPSRPQGGGWPQVDIPLPQQWPSIPIPSHDRAALTTRCSFPKGSWTSGVWTSQEG